MGASGLGSLLVKEGFLTEQDRLTITKTCGQGSWAFAKSILAIGLLDEEELAAFFAERTRYQIAPRNFLSHLDEAAIHALDTRLVAKLEVIPIKKDNGKITVGVVDPLDRSTLKQLEFFTGLEVDPVVIPLSQLYEGLARIDPGFRMQATALTHFLQNHAQSAWVRQKLETDGGGARPGPRVAAKTRSETSEIEEIADDIFEIEEIEDQDESIADIVEEVEDEDGMDPFGGTAEGEEDNDLGAEISARSGHGDDILEMVDEDEEGGIGGAGALGAVAGAGVAAADNFDADLDLLMDPDAGEDKSAEGGDSFEMEGGEFEIAAKDTFETASKEADDPFDLNAEFGTETAAEKPQDEEFDLEAALNDEALGERSSEAALPMDLGTESVASESNPDSAMDFDLDEALAGDEGGAAEGGDELLAGSSDDEDVDALSSDSGQDETVVKLRAAADKDLESEAKPPIPARINPIIEDHDPFRDEISDFDLEDTNTDEPVSSFGFEETKPRAMPRPDKVDVLETLNDSEPSIEAPGVDSDEVDEDLFADLHAEAEADDHSPDSLPKAIIPAALAAAIPQAFAPPPHPLPAIAAKNEFDDDEETHIDLRHSHVAAADLDDDDDIRLHPRKNAANPASDWGLNPTSALNETMLRISLSFKPDGILDILKDVLYKIGDAGCFINTKSQKQIVWGGGQLVKGDLSPSALLPMLKGGLPNRWQAIELKANESWTKQPMKLKLYRTGNWLWAHNMKNSDDTMIFRDTVESMAGQVMKKLEAG